MIQHKYILFILWILIPINIYAGIANYNQFPTLKPSHILDEELTNISFAFSMRVIESNYNGPLIRLRRASDNMEKDFGWGDNDIVNISAIDNWRNGSNVYIHTWYDQSGLNRNAIQTIQDQQPRFYTDINKPYFQGDGSNDHLTIDTPNGIQDVTNNGNQGTVLTVMNVTQKTQHSFGVLTDLDRWSTHANWSNNTLYFDPGICCNNPRYFANAAHKDIWTHYTFIKTATNAIARANTVEKFNGAHTTGKCTRIEDFAIGWATGNQANRHSTVKFLEFIMYKIDISSVNYTKIENNAIAFWSL